MAVVSTRAGRLGNRIAVAAVILITLIFLSPIYWITSTAFKPLLLSTTVPPTIVFEPRDYAVREAVHQACAAHRPC